MNKDIKRIPYRVGFQEYWRDYGKTITPFIIAIIILIAGQIANPGFLQMNHVLIMLKVASFVGILAIVQTTVIISGGVIDVSVGAIASLGALFSATIIKGGERSTMLAIVVVALMGMVLGMINGYMISYVRINPLIMTLAMSYVVVGIIIVFAQGRTLLGTASPALDKMINGKVFGIHYIVLIWLAVTIIAELILQKTRTGQIILSVGTNEMTSTLSGINVQFFRFLIFTLSGMLAAVFGVFLLGYVHTVFLDVGNPYLFPSIVACAIGGIALSGGSGSYIGTFGGALVYTFLISLMVTLNIDEALRKAFFGLILTVMLIIYARSTRRE